MYFGNQKFLVAGLSRSGEASTEFLLKRGAKVWIYDDVMTDTVAETVKKLEERGAKGVTAEELDRAVEICDVLVLSPGIPIDNALPIAFRKAGKNIIGECELGALFIRSNVVAVTGTNGKTTTVSMIDEALRACGKKSVPCGNYGNPLINVVDELSYDDFAVVEVSSFQLETLFSLRPHIAVVTNITEDHLNRHYNMENYIFLKSKLVRSLRESEFAVLNYDDDNVRRLAASTRGKVVWFSASRAVDGAYIQDGFACFKGKPYFPADKLCVGGAHNVQNALAALAVCGLLGLDMTTVSDALCAFKGVKHRIELVREVGGVEYIDDSKGTNVDATIKAVASLKRPAVLLVGGKDKGYDYGVLFENIASSKVVHVIIYGENRFKVSEAALRSGFYTFSMCTDFDSAVKLSSLVAKRGQCVLLSPASSSFDEFSSFEERGERFAKIVGGLSDE